MEISKELFESLKKCELDILSAFIDACGKLGLRYFVLQGTLLGAVRHHGFIPWDDDIDVGMMREDFEVFIKKAQDLLPDDLFIQTHETDPEYIQPFAKIRNSNTTFIETTASKLNINHGIYIDVFPLDYYPDGALSRAMLGINKALVKYRLRKLYYTSDEDAPLPKKCAISALGGAATVLWKDPEDAVKKRERIITKTQKGKKLINHGSPWGRHEIFNAEWTAGDVKLEFEGLTVNAMSGYHEYLTRVYGNYMELPPEDKRIPHHYADVIDPAASYKEYTSKNKI